MLRSFDQTGRLLTQAGGSGRDLNAAQLKYSNEVEAMYQRRIESIIAPMVGMGNVHAQVTAQIDFSAREQTDEQYQPNQPPDKAAVRSQQTSQSEQRGGPNVGGVPGALTNQPAPAPTAPIATQPNNANANANNQAGQQNQNNAAGTQANAANANTVIQTSNVRNDATTNYEVDKTILHTKHSTGGVKRLSAAVIVNYQPPGEDGKPVALTEEQIKQIETVAREAMGFSAERGDTLNVVNTPFMDSTDGSGELPFWQKQAFLDLLIEAGRWLLVLIVAWILWRKLVRPQLQRKTQQQEAALAAAALSQGADNDVMVNLSSSEVEQQRKSQQRVNAEMQSNRIREMAENDPRVVALVIRQWMSTEL